MDRAPRSPQTSRRKPRSKAPVAAPLAEQASAIDDPHGRMGIRLVIQREGEHVTLRGRGPSLIVPVQAGIAEVRISSSSYVVDRVSWLLVPNGLVPVVEAKSPVTHTLVLGLTDELAADVVRTYDGEIVAEGLASYVSRVELLPRTTWVNELCHRYLFERAVCRKKDNVATSFLEAEILKEVYFVCHERHTTRERVSMAAGTGRLVERAMTIIEEHLFAPDVVERVGKECGASASTVLRAFKREMGQAPLAYVRSRRLDEARLLLKSRKYSVGEVALMVGYRNFTAFSQAFRARFGRRPSDARDA